MSNPINHDVKQLTHLADEIKRRRKELNELKKAKAECEERILNYLEANDLPGMRHQGMTIIAEEKKKRRHVKKTERENRGAEILAKHGIYNSKEALDELLEAMRGSPEPKHSLRIL